jgi:hypothetical protein
LETRSVLFPRVFEPISLFPEDDTGRSLDYVLTKKLVPWSLVSRNTVRQVLTLAGKELDVPPAFLMQPDFKSKFVFLGGRTLGGLYHFVQRCPERTGSNTLPLLQDAVGIFPTADDLLVVLRDSARRHIHWETVPLSAITGTVEAFARYLKKPASMVTFNEIRTPNDFFGGNSLEGLTHYVFRHPERKNIDSTHFFLTDLGFRKQAADVIETIRLRDSIHSSPIQWRQVPWEAIGEIIEKVAQENGLPASMVTTKEIVSPCNFLGGSVLASLYRYCFRHQEKADGETGMQLLRRKVGIPDPARGDRARFRFIQMRHYFETLPQSTNPDDIDLWIKETAQLYKRNYTNIGIREIENEIYVFWNAFDKDEPFVLQTRLAALHAHIEGYYRRTLNQWYKNETCQVPNFLDKRSKASFLT